MTLMNFVIEGRIPIDEFCELFRQTYVRLSYILPRDSTALLEELNDVARNRNDPDPNYGKSDEDIIALCKRLLPLVEKQYLRAFQKVLNRSAFSDSRSSLGKTRSEFDRRIALVR
jgi:hypothetical protein